ncbi:MAG: type II secretion system minor pseudopilin GspI [Pseudomonadota bacterium]
MNANGDPLRPQAQAGFTLVEVLAALSVFSIAGLGLVHASTENARTAQFIERRAIASIVADNQLAGVLSSQNRVVLGDETDDVEMAGRSWRWTQTISETANPLIVEVTVSAQELDQEGDLLGGAVSRTAYRGLE